MQIGLQIILKPKLKFMKKSILSFILLCFAVWSNAQSPAISSWLINTTGATGRHYVQGNSTPINDADLVNVQSVQYSNNWVYVTATGVPAYITGPFLDGNPSFTTNQNAIFKMPLNPTQNTGTATATQGGNIGIFINGVAMFDYRDGVAWNATTSALCGGPGNPPCPGGPTATMPWNRDAIVAERAGFDCAKGHPAQGNYHHHQNPSAFKLDLTVISTICDIYDADGLYVINENEHSPLIGYSYDGFPVYGAYAFKNADGTGGITRMKSGYQLRNITTRTTSPTGATVTSGPNVSTTYPLGYFREDYEFITHAGEADYLDEHNGRFCVTPEYPNGIYCYFATVDASWNSAYPYLVGPTYYGNKTAEKVTSITETVTTYNPSTSSIDEQITLEKISVYPNPSNDVLMVQINSLLTKDLEISLIDINGKLIDKKTIFQGSTIAYFDVSTLYKGIYFLKTNAGQVLEVQVND